MTPNPGRLRDPAGPRTRALGQYFTGVEVADLVLGLGLERADDLVLDPACGDGVFLARAWYWRKYRGRPVEPGKNIKNSWGVELDPVHARRAELDLALAGVNIINNDFFALSPDDFPARFDLIVGNPPYTRHERVPQIAAADLRYKRDLIQAALHDRDGNPLARLSRRAGLHAYFIIHASKFLADGGRIAFVVPTSWLDADYGRGLREFILDRFQIVAVIESSVERWFGRADVNTCIVILHKRPDPAPPDAHPARFVSLSEPLSYFYPPAADGDDEVRLGKINDLARTIRSDDRVIEEPGRRILSVAPAGLREPGRESGASWGRYLRAPAIFYKIFDAGSGRFTDLSRVAEVTRGFTTGADPWFYVKDVTGELAHDEFDRTLKRHKYRGPRDEVVLAQSGDGSRWLIEREYLRPVLRNPAGRRTIALDPDTLRDLVVSVRGPRETLRGKLIEKYIVHGETASYPLGKGRNLIPALTRTCRERARWYELPDREPARLLWIKALDTVHRHYLAAAPLFVNQRFYAIHPRHARDLELLAAFGNSSLAALQLEVSRPAHGLGGLETTVDEVKRMLVPVPGLIPADLAGEISAAFNNLARRETGSVFDEIGAQFPDEVRLDRVRPDRRELDRLWRHDVLGLSEDDQLDLYRALVGLTRARLMRARRADRTVKLNQKEE